MMIAYDSNFNLSNNIPKKYVTCTLNILKIKYIPVTIFMLFLIKCNAIDNLLPSNDGKILDNCQRCKILVNSFKEGLKKTARGKHEGGDAHWEENKLNNYADSEIRLTDIQENLCNEVTIGKDQCHSFAEQYENELEEWFLNNRKKERQEPNLSEGDTLYEYLCNTISKACCPDGHFGNKCQPCIGFPDQICLNRGYCSGNGTRQGNGKCICHDGFDGEFCEKCSTNYMAVGMLEKTLNNNKIQMPEKCLQCDPSCASTCHSQGPKGCHVCRKGYVWDNDHGCMDIDECDPQSMQLNPCKFNTYCINTQGSYSCYPCHESCKGCTNRGSNSCIECAKNHHMTNDHNCIKNEETFFGKYFKKMNMKMKPTFRYFCYGIMSYIIFKIRNKLLLSSCLSIILSIVITFIEMPEKIFDLL